MATAMAAGWGWDTSCLGTEKTTRKTGGFFDKGEEETKDYTKRDPLAKVLGLLETS